MPENGIVPLSRLRASVEDAVEARGLRSVARELGLDHRGVSRFIQGTRPHPSTRQKLERWYLQRQARSDDAVDSVTAAAALRTLLKEIPPRGRAAAWEEAIDALRRIHDSHGESMPKWLGVADLDEAGS